MSSKTRRELPRLPSCKRYPLTAVDHILLYLVGSTTPPPHPPKKKAFTRNFAEKSRGYIYKKIWSGYYALVSVEHTHFFSSKKSSLHRPCLTLTYGFLREGAGPAALCCVPD